MSHPPKLRPHHRRQLTGHVVNNNSSRDKACFTIYYKFFSQVDRNSQMLLTNLPVEVRTLLDLTCLLLIQIKPGMTLVDVSFNTKVFQGANNTPS